MVGNSGFRNGTDGLHWAGNIISWLRLRLRLLDLIIPAHKRHAQKLMIIGEKKSQHLHRLLFSAPEFATKITLMRCCELKKEEDIVRIDFGT